VPPGLPLSAKCLNIGHVHLTRLVQSRIVFDVLALAALFCLAQAQPAPPPPPGQRIDLGGRRLHLNCQGNGAPTVIVENGGGGFSVEWALVQPQIARLTRICTYDRAGYAWSDPGPVFDGIEQIMDHLHLLLSKADIRLPYVLVGASLGCIYARAYQRRYPGQVAGLVFVDGTHDEGVAFPVDGSRVPISRISADQLPRAYAEYRRGAPQFKPGPAGQEPFDRLPAELQQVRHWANVKLLSQVGLLPAGEAAAESWRQEFTALRRQRLSESHPLGDLPLIVLARSADSDESRHTQQAQLAALSSNGKLVTAADSGHAIHLYRPNLVAGAIREVVEAARRRR